MRSDKLQDAIGEVKNEYIEDAELEVTVKKWNWAGWAAIAACFCLIAAGTVFYLVGKTDSPEVAKWSSKTTPQDYFRNSGKSKSERKSDSADLVMAPYAVSVGLSDERGRLEADGVIPVMPEHPEQGFTVAYNGDGSLYKVDLLWMRRGGSIEEYSDLSFTAAPGELHEISDTIFIHVDESGNEIPPYVTVTERDGILIYAEGRENENKTLTWETSEAWYRISGSFKDSYEDMVKLLDWFWEHPLELSLFAEPPEDSFVCFDRVDQQDAFSGMIPDFLSLAYTAESERVNLGRAIYGKMLPVWFEGIYSRGETRIKWTLNTGADADSWAANLGRLSEITEEKVNDAITRKNSFNIFFYSRLSPDETPFPCMATLTVEQGTASDAWEIIDSMKSSEVYR